ncbi:type II toxin-antitoxin system RelE/ParE family toxin [Thiohalophilus sp.]|uniref:type II toxin-antitoxin system RelE/ParE family toxin n=1 Tax=Thiohalophilus sp. TaxID=3028392 RepID=UPI002ACDAB08|nr:type II toxin-antitoxin system RelE/ParE family toxin [Thiohalophilus sp.]MDZ7803823.1 type II toxin-antitoxin system RelE/ParE family toxin [Thiohalophilus sp.]
MKRISSQRFNRWMKRLKDEKGKGIILARIHHLMEGWPSDVTPLGQGLNELWIHYGPGYQVYFHQRGTR